MNIDLRIHVQTFLWLLPLVVMLIWQRMWGLGDNLLAAPRPGMRDGATFNLLLALVFWVGAIGFFVHALKYASLSKGWLALKLVVLAGLFISMGVMTVRG